MDTRELIDLLSKIHSIQLSCYLNIKHFLELGLESLFLRCDQRISILRNCLLGALLSLDIYETLELYGRCIALGQIKEIKKDTIEKLNNAVEKLYENVKNLQKLIEELEVLAL